MAHKIFKKVLWFIVAILLLLLVFVISVIAPIDYTPLSEISQVAATYKKLNDESLNASQGEGQLLAGWSAVNITPKSPIKMAGYGPRGPYTSVLDSLYSRIIVFDNGNTEAVIITIDLLLFPRLLKQALQEQLSKLGFSENEIYLNATHTHSGFGNWEKSLAGKFIFGDFDQDNFDYLLELIINGVNDAKIHKSPIEVGFQKINANELVSNRLAGNEGTKDPYLRVISLQKGSGQKALMVSFSGHPVNLVADAWELSRDYPGILVDKLEQENNVDFAMFCAGMVGSHNIEINLPKGHKRIEKVGGLLSDKILNELDSMDYSSNSTLGTLDFKIDLPPSQLKLSNKYGLRDWFFSALMGPLEANIKILEIGPVMMIGMPCDYSGELSINNQLDKLGERYGKKLFITSFNGNYVGYITEDGHYTTCNHDEVKTLNWVGPYKGAYFTEIIKKVIVLSAQ